MNFRFLTHWTNSALAALGFLGRERAHDRSQRARPAAGIVALEVERIDQLLERAGMIGRERKHLLEVGERALDPAELEEHAAARVERIERSAG